MVTERITPLLFMLALAACASGPERPPLGDAELERARAAFVEENNSAYRADNEKILRRMELEVRLADDPAGVSYDVLMVHGGGPSGGFTAGFMLGWGEVEDPEYARPAFDMVTGSSAGALVAPFPFLGTAQSYQQMRDMTLDPPFRFGKPSLRSFWPGRSSINETDSLRAALGDIFDEGFVENVRQASSEHRSLMVSGTNVNLGLGRFWDLGRQIEGLDDAAAATRLRDLVMASAAVPIMFPPVIVDGNAYIDGGVSANIFVGFDERSIREIAETWQSRHPEIPMPVVRVWVVMSRELFMAPESVALKYPSIGQRALNIMMEYDRLKTLAAMVQMIEDLDETPGIRAELRYAAPPPSAGLPTKMSEVNDPEIANAVLELGRATGSNPDNWRREIPDTYLLERQ